MHASRLIIVSLLVCLPLGCVSQQSQQTDRAQFLTSAEWENASTEQIVAMDFINAMRQIDSLLPTKTTINLLRMSRTDDFTVTMQTALQAAGYGVRWVSDTSSGQLFQYRLEQGNEVGSGKSATYEMAVGGVELRRSYQLTGLTGIGPLTPLYIRGADASEVVLNDLYFRTAGVAEADTNVVPDAELVEAAVAQSTPPAEAPVSVSSSEPLTRSRLTVPDAANPLNPVVSGATTKPNLRLPLANLTRVENVFDLGESNFEDLLAEHEVVDELILMFPNDSLRLGAVNKRLVDEMVRSFEPESDLFSVIGCSLGPTELESGNAALALGRASRVREALLFAGIPQDRILDEGCWAGDSAGNTLPRRGVVVTLNRQD